jgi:hypothetical protein
MVNTADLSLLDRYAAFPDADVDARRFSVRLIRLVGQNRCGDREYANNNVQDVSVHPIYRPC